MNLPSNRVDIIPAAIPHDRAELERNAETAVRFANRFHLDVNDGVFVPAVSWPCGENQWEELERAAAAGRLPHFDALRYEVHLMAADPLRLGELFARAGAEAIVGHIEAFADEGEAREALKAWRVAGAREVGVTLLLDTPLSKVDSLAEDIDIAQVMSIARVGFQKQSFDERAVGRVRELHARNPGLAIVVDGGVSERNARLLAEAGASRLVVGSAIMHAADPAAAYAALLEAAGAAS